MSTLTASATDKREAIIKATLKLSIEYGFEGMSTALIAKEANVGMGTLYRYFETKEHLLKEVFAMLREKMLFVILSGIGNFDQPISEQFRHIVKLLCRYYIDHELEFRFLQKYSDSPYMKETYLDDTALILEPISGILTSGGEGFRFRPYPTHVIFAMVYGPMIAIINLIHVGKVQMTDDLLEDLIESIWDSITVPDITPTI
jgi:AcrR family transcriptional regulator